MKTIDALISILFRVLVGAIFVVAGEIKLYHSLVGYLSSELRVGGINVIPWLGAAELAIGVLVLAGIAPRIMTLTVIAVLCSFVSYSAASWGVGNARCGCFGQVPVAPGHAFVLDLGLLALSLAALRIESSGASAKQDSGDGPVDSLSSPSPVLIATLLWSMLCLQPASSTAAETSLKDRFLKEFPAAHRKLQEAASHAEGEARYLRTDDLANRKVKRREDMKWGSFRFMTKNDSLRIDQITAGGGTETNVSLVLTPGFNFRVLAPNSSSAQLVDISRDIKGKLLKTHALYWRDYFPACYLFAEATLEEWLKRPGFQLESVEPDPDDPELVRITYVWDGAEWLPKEKQSLFLGFQVRGQWWLSPAEDWAIRRTAYHQSYSYEEGGKELSALESVNAEVDVQQISNLGFVPRRVQITTSGSNSDRSALKEVGTQICEFENVRKSTAGDDVFTPAALGVGDPRKGVSTWFIVLNVGAILLLLAAWIGWRRRTNR